ncbi:MAG: SU10 major capsid protein [Burkholderiales bacterium]
MAAIAGLRGTGDWATDERPKNFRETILWRDPNGMTPLTGLMAKMGSQATDDPEFAWYEEQLNLLRVQSDAVGLAAASTALGLTGGGLDLVVGDLLLVEKADAATYDNEIVEVSTVTSDTAIVVKRGQAGTAAAATGVSFYATKIGNRFAEGTASPEASSRNPTKIYNYCQIFKTAYEMTNTARKTRTRTGDPLKNDKKRKMFDHAVAMELAWFYGTRSETTGSNGKPMRTTGGLRSYITTNKTVFSTTPTVNTFLDAIYPVFDYAGSGAGNERIIFAGNGALNALNKIIGSNANVKVNYDGVIKQYGMALQQFVTPQGIFYIKTHPLLNTHPRYKDSMFVLNPAAMKYRHFRDTAAQDNIQANDEDTHKGQWLTEAGLELNHERTFAYLGNFTSP